MPETAASIDGVKHGQWLRLARDGTVEKRDTFADGKAQRG
jgi:hypothetical protein